MGARLPGQHLQELVDPCNSVRPSSPPGSVYAQAFQLMPAAGRLLLTIQHVLAGCVDVELQRDKGDLPDVKII
jgi:hypothetical protein